MACGGCGHKYFRPPRTGTVGAATKRVYTPRPARVGWRYIPPTLPPPVTPAPVGQQPAVPVPDTEKKE